MTVKLIYSRKAYNAKVHRGIPATESTHYDGDQWDIVPSCGARMDVANASIDDVAAPPDWMPLCPKNPCFGGGNWPFDENGAPR